MKCPGSRKTEMEEAGKSCGAIDLRKLCSREKWQIKMDIQNGIREGLSYSAIARKKGIDRRTVKKLSGESAVGTTDKRHSPITRFVKVLLERLDRVGIDQALKECTFTGRHPQDKKQVLAFTMRSLVENIPEISDPCLSGPQGANPHEDQVSTHDFLSSRLNYSDLQRLKPNEPIIRTLIFGVIPKGNFLNNNLDVFKTAIQSHPDEKPDQILSELSFCLWYLFGNQGEIWMQQVNKAHFRWHVHRVRKLVAAAREGAKKD